MQARHILIRRWRVVLPHRGGKTSGEGNRGEAEYWTKAPPKQFVLKRDGKEGRLLILQLPEGPTAFIEFTVCREDSVVERAKLKEDKCRLLADDWAKKHKRHSVVLPIVLGTSGVIPKQTVASLAKLKAWGFDCKRHQA